MRESISITFGNKARIRRYISVLMLVFGFEATNVCAQDTEIAHNDPPRVQEDVVYERSAALALEIRAATFARTSNPFVDADGKSIRESGLDGEAMFDQAMKRYRFSSQSVIDTHAAYLIALWSVYHRKPLPHAKLAYAVNHQVGEVHRRDTNEIGEDKKQILAHNFMWDTLILLAQRNKPNANLDRLSQAALRMSRQSGFDLSLFKLTEGGLVRD
jgi:hypothetical protein